MYPAHTAAKVPGNFFSEGIYGIVYSDIHGLFVSASYTFVFAVPAEYKLIKYIHK